MSDYLYKGPCYIHSLKREGEHIMAEATIIKKLGENDYLAEYRGVKCHAMLNPIVSRYFVDDVYGIIREPGSHDHESR